jgi:hypothetical protein
METGFYSKEKHGVWVEFKNGRILNSFYYNKELSFIKLDFPKQRGFVWQSFKIDSDLNIFIISYGVERKLARVRSVAECLEEDFEEEP